jgi:hypothetical protein
MTDFPNFGEIPGHVTLYDVQREAKQRAKDEAKALILNELLYVTTDENGRHLSERKWRKHYALIERL